MQLVAINCFLMTIIVLFYDEGLAEPTVSVPTTAMGNMKDDVAKESQSLATGCQGAIDDNKRMYPDKSIHQTLAKGKERELVNLEGKIAGLEEDKAKIEKELRTVGPDSAEAKSLKLKLDDANEALMERLANMAGVSGAYMVALQVVAADPAVSETEQVTARTQTAVQEKVLEQQAEKLDEERKSYEDRINIRLEQATDATTKNKLKAKLKSSKARNEEVYNARQKAFDVQIALTTDESVKLAALEKKIAVETKEVEKMEEEYQALEAKAAMETDPETLAFLNEFKDMQRANFKNKAEDMEVTAAQQQVSVDVLLTSATGAEATALNQKKASAQKKAKKAKKQKTKAMAAIIEDQLTDTTNPAQKAVLMQQQYALLTEQQELATAEAGDLRIEELELEKLRNATFNGQVSQANAAKTCKAYPSVLAQKAELLELRYGKEGLLSGKDIARDQQQDRDLEQQQGKYDDMCADAQSICSIAVANATDDEIEEMTRHVADIMKKQMAATNSQRKFMVGRRMKYKELEQTASTADKAMLGGKVLLYSEGEIRVGKQIVEKTAFQAEVFTNMINIIPASSAAITQLRQMQDAREGELDAGTEFFNQQVAAVKKDVNQTLSTALQQTFAQSTSSYVELNDSSIGTMQTALQAHLIKPTAIEAMKTGGLTAAGNNTGLTTFVREDPAAFLTDTVNVQFFTGSEAQMEEAMIAIFGNHSDTVATFTEPEMTYEQLAAVNTIGNVVTQPPPRPTGVSSAATTRRPMNNTMNSSHVSTGGAIVGAVTPITTNGSVVHSNTSMGNVTSGGVVTAAPTVASAHNASMVPVNATMVPVNATMAAVTSAPTGSMLNATVPANNTVMANTTVPYDMVNVTMMYNVTMVYNVTMMYNDTLINATTPNSTNQG